MAAAAGCTKQSDFDGYDFLSYLSGFLEWIYYYKDLNQIIMYSDYTVKLVAG